VYGPVVAVHMSVNVGDISGTIRIRSRRDAWIKGFDESSKQSVFQVYSKGDHILIITESTWVVPRRRLRLWLPLCVAEVDCGLLCGRDWWGGGYYSMGPWLGVEIVRAPDLITKATRHPCVKLHIAVYTYDKHRLSNPQ
jgi:hypothetical protein